MRYFLLKNIDTLEVYLSQDLETQPENSVPFFSTDFKRTVFDQYPNPTTVIEDVNFIPEIDVPPTISQMKFRMQLILSGISIASIYTMIESISDATQRELIYTKFEYAVYLERTDPTLNQMAEMLGVNQEQLDQIFINGNTL